MVTRTYTRTRTTEKALPDLRNRIVTPSTDPDRWTDEEKDYFNRGLCSWDVGAQYFGQTDHLCGAKSKPGASFVMDPATMAALEEEWKAAKVDEWCAVAGLRQAAPDCAATGRPNAAPIEFVLTDAERKATGSNPVRRALTAYQQAATLYEGVRVHLADLRNRATAPT
ncbi:hypothetical protein [Actinomadura sp. 3N407]|uniref:hypothetical protein n=1 Tax=Actinomadura sp. 3N407 TaxID=3457423 RepID=UPI003FCE7820